MTRRTKRFELVALAYNKRGKLLAVGHNSYVKTHPLQAKYGRLSGKPKAIYLHAELHALIKAKEQVHKLVILRYNKNGLPATAKPCAGCQLAIKDYGVKNVEHT